MNPREKAAALRRQMAQLAVEADAYDNAPDLDAMPNHTVVRFTRSGLTYAAIKIYDDDVNKGITPVWWTTSSVHVRKRLLGGTLLEWILEEPGAIDTLEIWSTNGPAEARATAWMDTLAEDATVNGE